MIAPAPLPLCVFHKWELLDHLMTDEIVNGPFTVKEALIALASIKADILRFGSEKKSEVFPTVGRTPTQTGRRGFSAAGFFCAAPVDRKQHRGPRRLQIRGSAPLTLRSASIQSRDPAPHLGIQKRPATRDHGSRDRRQEISMSNVDYARSRLDTHRVVGIVSFVIFTFECARRYYNVSWWPDQNWSAWSRGPIRHQ